MGGSISKSVTSATIPGDDFDGVTCVDAGCGRKYGLEWDHRNPLANRGETSYANLDPRCKPSHWEKTRRDREAGLLGGRRAPPAESPP